MRRRAITPAGLDRAPRTALGVHATFAWDYEYSQASKAVDYLRRLAPLPCPRKGRRDGPADHAQPHTTRPLYDVHPRTGSSIEVFYADRTLETFGKGGAGWFWWSRRRGFSPNGAPTGPFATRYAAYRHALGTNLGAKGNILLDTAVKSEV